MSTETTQTSEERQRAAREALIGNTVAGRYVLRALIGHGGMGAVYEAEHLGLGKRVAIKFIDQDFAKDEQIISRFAREARAMSAIESAHIVSVFDAGSEDKRPFLVMELLRGEDLGQRLRRTRRVPLDESMHVIAQVLKGLAKAHAAGIVHRDLKPDNVFLVRTDTDPLFAKIVDFGVSKIERPRAATTPLALTGRGTVLGTPFYMSPEQAQAASDVDPRTDIFSVGAILFECLSGRPPHTGETYEQVILSICMREAPDLRAIDPGIPSEVAGFVARALARDKAERFASAERMLAALHEIAPAEKKRVPLDQGAPVTLMSPGVLLPHAQNERPELPNVATQLGVPPIGAATVVSPPPVMGPTLDPNVSYALPSRGTKKRGTLMLTAIIAALAGVAVVFVVIALVGRRTPATVPPAPTISSAVPTVTPSVSTVETAPPTLSAPPAVSVSASAPQHHHAPPKPSAKKLDISRDLE